MFLSSRAYDYHHITPYLRSQRLRRIRGLASDNKKPTEGGLNRSGYRLAVSNSHHSSSQHSSVHFKNANLENGDLTVVDKQIHDLCAVAGIS
jgi:hypothetical protein